MKLVNETRLDYTAPEGVYTHINEIYNLSSTTNLIFMIKGYKENAMPIKSIKELKEEEVLIFTVYLNNRPIMLHLCKENKVLTKDGYTLASKLHSGDKICRIDKDNNIQEIVIESILPKTEKIYETIFDMPNDVDYDLIIDEMFIIK